LEIFFIEEKSHSDHLEILQPKAKDLAKKNFQNFFEVGCKLKKGWQKFFLAYFK
jgi:hypothetical protein